MSYCMFQTGENGMSNLLEETRNSTQRIEVTFQLPLICQESNTDSHSVPSVTATHHFSFHLHPSHCSCYKWFWMLLCLSGRCLFSCCSLGTFSYSTLLLLLLLLLLLNREIDYHIFSTLTEVMCSLELLPFNIRRLNVQCTENGVIQPWPNNTLYVHSFISELFNDRNLFL